MASKLEPIWGELKSLTRSFFYSPAKTCLLCEKSSTAGEICSHCQEEYFYPELPRCLNCGKLIPKGEEKCTDCLAGKGPKSLDKVVSLGHYSGAWREFIQKVKYKAQPYQLQ